MIRKNGYLIIILLLFSSCAGTIHTVKRQELAQKQFKKAYIISADNSQYIQFKFGIITPVGYFVLPDDPAQKHEVIGNTATVIKQELEKYGIQAEIGQKGDKADGYDLIILYQDTWRWDMKKILDKLEIVFVSSDGKTEIARSTYNIYKNKELHNFPSPEKEVPKMIKELLTSQTK